MTAHPNQPDSAVRVTFTLNGSALKLDVPPAERLLDTLRYRLNLPGTKEGCGEGECGACTVLIDNLPANSCLVPTFQCRGRDVRTIESVDPASLTPMLNTGATQCGACTPGVVMTAQWIRENPRLLGTHTCRALMAGNLCRCTGYDGIIDGVSAMVADAAPSIAPRAGDCSGRCACKKGGQG